MRGDDQWRRPSTRPLKLIILSTIIITLLMVEPKGVTEGLRKVKEYFRLWPFAYERG